MGGGVLFVCWKVEGKFGSVSEDIGLALSVIRKLTGMARARPGPQVMAGRRYYSPTSVKVVSRWTQKQHSYHCPWLGSYIYPCLEKSGHRYPQSESLLELREYTMNVP